MYGFAYDSGRTETWVHSPTKGSHAKTNPAGIRLLRSCSQ
jgi:hypothetical protein